MSPTNISESAQAKSPAKAATQTSSNNPALNNDAKYAQAMKEYNQAIEDRENEFRTRSAEKIEQLNVAYEKIHTKLMSFADISTRESLTIKDFRKLVQPMFEELDAIRDELGNEFDAKRTQSFSRFAK